MSDFSEHLQAALGTNYQLDRELTGGGMSRVFVATDLSLGRKVVVKVLPPELAAGVNRDRFRREIQVAAQLQHPHIVPLLSAGEQGDLLWYTMPYIEGESLRAALERKRHFTVREVMRLLHDIVDALAFAHERGVVHRDIKPANILTQGAHALVTDFGVAKALSASMPVTGLTSAGIAIGTPAYMAPEQLAGDASADQRVDIYAVGLLAYELVTGVSPFTGPSPRETLAAQLTRDPQPLHELSAEVPRSLSTLIMRCLAKDPAERPQTADEILNELDSMTMPLTVSTQASPVRPVSPNSRMLAFVAAAIMVVVIGAVGFSVVRHRSTAPPGDSAQSLPTPPKRPLPAAPPTTGATVAFSMTPADSARIADETRKQIEAARLRDSLNRVAVADLNQRKMVDSIIAANSGSGATSVTGPRRLIIAEPSDVPGWPQATAVGRAVGDSLRRMLRTRPQFTIVNPDSVRQELLTSRNVNVVTKSLNTDVVVSIKLRALPNDSAVLILTEWDLTAAPAFRQRIQVGHPGPKNQVLADLDAMLIGTVSNLDEMSRARRRAPGETAPPVPGAPGAVSTPPT
ncbi:MAG TPA: serine/threonine-protein kinase [Gemmatimonadaceae bacterium]|jgi:serine/threonine protein kinase